MADPPIDPGRTAAQRAGDCRRTARRIPSRVDRGWTVLARNVHVGRHELDLVAEIEPGSARRACRRGGPLARQFDRAFGLPEETVDHRKRVRVRTAAYGLLDRGAFGNGVPSPVSRSASTWSSSSRNGAEESHGSGTTGPRFDAGLV